MEKHSLGGSTEIWTKLSDFEDISQSRAHINLVPAHDMVW